MNPQQQREEARRRRLVNRSVVQHRQRHFDDVRRGVVTPTMMLNRDLPRGTLNPVQGEIGHPVMIDNPAITRMVKVAIIGTMAGLLLQFQSPLSTLLLSLIAG